MRKLVIALLVCLPALAASFTPPCELPFVDIATKRPIDSRCSASGQGSDSSQLQNESKNNFCATGEPALITFVSFKRLQSKAESPSVLGPNYKVPESREMLQELYTTTEGDTIGEGSVVMFAAFVGDAHYSNVSKGETVNCKLTGQANNDIHIELVQNLGEPDTCKSVTAEITPHFRPTVWASKTLNDIDRPIRFTGQLFFDASHHPCHDNVRPNPKRASSWEIHPVYNIEVCKNTSLAGCKANDDSKWMSLEEYLNQKTKEDEEEEGDS